MSKTTIYSLLPIGFIVLVILLAYWGLNHTFYQQDEWQQLGLIYGGYLTPNVFAGHSIWQILFGEGRILSGLMYYFLFSFFPFQMMPIAVVAIFFHCVNAVLLFFLVRKLSKSQVIALVAALFFGVNAVAHEAITWAAASIGTLPATTLILLAIFAYINYLDTQKRGWLFGSFGLALFSLLFKEIGIFLFLFFPALSLIYQKKPQTLKMFVRANWPFLIYGLLIALFRLSQFFFADNQKIGAIATGAVGFKEKLIVRLFLYPVTGLSQLFSPPLKTYELAETFAELQYPYLTPTPMAEIVPQTIVADMLAIVGTVLIIYLVFMVNRYRKGNAQLALFAASLVFLSLIPYAVLERGGSYLDSRYYYVAAMGAGILLGYIFEALYSQKIVWKIFGILLLTLMLGLHIQTNRETIRAQRDIARQRLSILHTIADTYPTLGEKNVFYITGKQDYYIPDNKLPIQQGMGYTLMVWYFNTGRIPADLLSTKYLWDIGTQGYKEVGEQGFGFFSQFDQLLENYQAYGLTPENIVSFHWDSDRQVLRDTTNQTRSQLP